MRASPAIPLKCFWKLSAAISLFLCCPEAAFMIPVDAHAAGCDAVVGKWAWFVGGEVTINADGTFTQQSGNTGTWECTDASKNAVTLKWAKGGFVNKMVLSDDQQAMASIDASQAFVKATRVGTKVTDQPKLNPNPVPPAAAPTSAGTSSSDYELFTKGRDLAASGKCREAIPYFDQAIAANPRYWKAYSDRGRCLASLGQRDRGLADLGRAVEPAPHEMSPYFNRAGLKADAGDGDGALADLDQSVRLDPMNPASRGARAGLFDSAGRSREAQLDRDIAYRQVETLKPNMRPVLDQVVKNWRAKSVKLTSNPPRDDDSVQVALKAMEAGHYRAALAILEHVLANNSSDDASLGVRGQIHLVVGQPTQAVEDLTAVLQRRSSPTLYLARGLALRQLCKFREEVADYDRAIKEDPRFARAYLERAFTTTHFKKGNDPAPDLTKVIELEPNNWGAYYLRGQEYGYWFNKIPLALADYRRVIELKPDFAQAYCNMAFALREVGRKGEADAWLQKCFALDPSERAVAKQAAAKLKAKEELLAREMAARASMSTRCPPPVMDAKYINPHAPICGVHY